MKTLLLSHPLFLEYGDKKHPENPYRLASILKALQNSPFQSLLNLKQERIPTQAELETVHTPSYIQKIRTWIDKPQQMSGQLDGDTPITASTAQAAFLAAGLGIKLTEDVVLGHIQQGFLLARPPGHHARPDTGMGFCIFNSIALAAQKALFLGLKRILILDWDVHHGNGTQEIFYKSNQVLFMDLHQEDLFPKNSGLAQEQGEGIGLGYTCNYPLLEASTDEDFLDVIKQEIVPRARAFKPELILISAGFDAHEKDPLGSMSLTTKGYGKITQTIKTLSQELCGGKWILFLEGGYVHQDLAASVLETVSALSSTDLKHL